MKLEELKKSISQLKEATIAFSGGIDSTLVAKIAHETLGKKAIACTIASEFTSEDDVLYSVKIAKEIGIRHKIIRINILDEKISKNPKNRCYLCKKKILLSLPGKNILDGTNADDDKKRPGMKALKEFGVFSPLKECGIKKHYVRMIAKDIGLSNYNKESNSCLATRIPFNSKITYDKLKKVETAEKILTEQDICNVRARLKDEKFILEIPGKYFKRYEESSKEINEKIYQTNIKAIDISER